MFSWMEFSRAYIDDLLVITKCDCSDHLDKLEAVIKKLRVNCLKCNIERSYLGKTDMEYLGFWVTRTGIWPINKKVEAIVNTKPPKNEKQVCSFIGLVNYYRDIWAKQSHLLQPLTALTSKKVKLKWTVVKHKVFD